MNIQVNPTDVMSIDRRESILERLLVLGQGLSGIASAYRNHGPPPTGILGTPRPTFLLYDGDTRLTQDVLIHKSRRMPPTIWLMDPQIAVVLENRDTIENIMLDGVLAPVGPELSSWMNIVRSSVVNDPVITDLVSANGTHFLNAVETDQKVGRAMGAYGSYVLMTFHFYYPLFPTQP